MRNDKRNGNRKRNYNGLNFELTRVVPMTENQAIMFDSNKNVVAHGWAGTGKTFVASYLAFDKIFNKEEYDKLIYIRSAVPTRDMGFLPGTEKEKAEAYETPYKDIANELFNRGDAYELLKTKHKVQFMTTSFIRGTTLRDAAIVVDECQNMSYHELDSIITRVGDNCKIYFCGDIRQPDLDKNGIQNFYKVLKSMPDDFDFIEFGIDDVVRGGLMKNYLKAKYAIFGDRQLS